MNIRMIIMYAYKVANNIIHYPLQLLEGMGNGVMSHRATQLKEHKPTQKTV